MMRGIRHNILENSSKVKKLWTDSNKEVKKLLLFESTGFCISI